MSTQIMHCLNDPSPQINLNWKDLSLIIYKTMKTRNPYCLFYLFFLCLFMVTCTNDRKPGKIASQGDYPPPPAAPVIPDTLKEFGNTRIDNYFWLKDRSDPEVMAYLKAENAYCDTVMSHTRDLQDTLYLEMKGRIKEDDQTVPQLDNGYYYYDRTEKDRQYPIYCRKKGDLNAPEVILFDVNEMAKGTQAYLFGGYEITSDNRLAAYTYNTTGSYAEFTLRVRNLETGQDLPFELSRVLSFVWANDNKTLFYTVGNEALRPYRVYRHTLNSKSPDDLIFEEKDDLFNVYVAKSKTRDFIYTLSRSFTTSEYRYLEADKPSGEFQVFRPRQKDVDYAIQHHKSGIYIKYKDLQNINSRIYLAPLRDNGDISSWKEVVAHDPAVKIQDMDVFERYLTLFIRIKGLYGIEVIDLASGDRRSIEFPEPVYVVSPTGTPEYTSTKYRYAYSSLNRPSTVFDYDMVTGTSEKLKEQEIPSGFNANDYVVERLWAPSPDGLKIPMAVLHRKSFERNGRNPALVYGYGSYGYNTDAYFRSTVFSLVDRGFVYAIAQIRGGSEMGEQWYEDGKLMKKKNTFNDFIACAEYLVKEKYTSPSRLAIHGGSAGGDAGARGARAGAQRRGRGEGAHRGAARAGQAPGLRSTSSGAPPRST